MENPCAGCLGSDDNKPEFCSQRCAIVNCNSLIQNRYRFCTACADYPCEQCNEREVRYMSQYAMKESPFKNLADIQDIGMDAFLLNQSAKWTCKHMKCDGVICVHTGVCNKCGNQHSAEDITG